MIILVPVRVGHNDPNFGWCCGPDGTGSIGVEFSFRNDSDKSIRTATFVFVPKDASGQIVSCTKTGYSEFAARYTGLLTSGSVAPTMYVEHCWVNAAIVEAEVSRVEITYADGSRESLYGDRIRYGSATGCYIATCIYGSYDCPPVWILRRFRDQKLSRHPFGRLLIRGYYAISPRLVRRWGSRCGFRTWCRRGLDALVRTLYRHGFADTPYQDPLYPPPSHRK